MISNWLALLNQSECWLTNTRRIIQNLLLPSFPPSPSVMVILQTYFIAFYFVFFVLGYRELDFFDAQLNKDERCKAKQNIAVTCQRSRFYN